MVDDNEDLKKLAEIDGKVCAKYYQRKPLTISIGTQRKSMMVIEGKSVSWTSREVEAFNVTTFGEGQDQLTITLVPSNQQVDRAMVQFRPGSEDAALLWMRLAKKILPNLQIESSHLKE